MLTQLSHENYEIVRNLFPNNYPNLAFIQAAIEKKIKGEIWVDDANNPQSALVICSFYFFLSGKITQKVFDDSYRIITDRIKELEKMSANVRNYLSLVCPQQMMMSPISFEALGFVSASRTEYVMQKVSLSEYKNNSGYDLIPINRDNISHCLWFRFISDIIGNENLHHHLGYMLWDKESECVVSEAYGIVGSDHLEICTITNPDAKYIKKGFSTNVCTHLIVEATKKGLHPIWSCSKDNLPSNKTAQRLGMDARQEYVFHNIGMKASK